VHDGVDQLIGSREISGWTSSSGFPDRAGYKIKFSRVLKLGSSYTVDEKM